MLEQGGARDYLDGLNLNHGTDHVLWDHDYTSIGLKALDGDLLGYSYLILNDNTDPDGLYAAGGPPITRREIPFYRGLTSSHSSPVFPPLISTAIAMPEQY